MRKLALTCLATVAFISSGLAQQTLFTYGNNPVSKDEFLRVYQKNAINKKPDFSDSALRDYLNLYSLFRMKVKEAERMQLDTVPSIQSELDNYRKQLARNYLTDEEVSNKLVREAYDRMKEEVRVTHILIMAQPNMAPDDTLKAYKRIDSIYKAITKGKADFAALASQYSEDRGSKTNGGEIGYMTGMQTVYPFENVVFGTPVGKVSAPFRTQFGYHIVKVLDRRPARGEVQVSHILILTPKSKGDEGMRAAEARIDSIKTMLKNGANFGELAKKYSEDKLTVNEGGLMQPFGVGRVAPAFEAAAFNLKNVGDVSAPVKTDYGIHLVKLEKKIPLKPYDSVVVALKRRVDNDSRSQMARDIYFEKVKTKHGFKEYPAAMQPILAKVNTIPDTGKDANVFTKADFAKMNQPLFSLGGKNYLQSDMMAYAENLTRGRLMGPKEAVVRDIYKMYVQTVVNDYQEHMLVEENWGKASRDSAGLKTFYDKNKSKYLWDPGFSGSVYRFKDEAAMKNGMKALAKKDVKDEDVLKQVNTETTPDAVSVQHGHFEYTRFKEVPQSAIAKAKNLTEPVKNADGSYTVVRVQEVFNTATVKGLDDARGYAVAEYQDYLEKQWNAELRAKYPVKLNDDVYKTMVKK